MKNKIIKLNESDLLRIVKKVICENQESDLAKHFSEFIKNELSPEDFKFIFKIYNKLGKDKFEDVVEDGITDAIDDIKNDNIIDEKISLSKKGIDVENEDDLMKVFELKNKINNISTNYLRSLPVNILPIFGATIGLALKSLETGEPISNGMVVLPIITSSLLSGFMLGLGTLGQELSKRTPVNLNYKYPKSIVGTPLEKKLFNILDGLINPWEFSYENVFEKLKSQGVPDNLVSSVIHDFERQKNIQFVRYGKKRNKQKNYLPIEPNNYTISPEVKKVNYKRKE